MKAWIVGATEFKAKCLSLIDQVEKEGGTITITKRGRPVAVLEPVRKKPLKSPAGIWAGKVHLPENLESLDLSHLWEVVRETNLK
jgi:prevent-host-death family protein